MADDLDRASEELTRVFIRMSGMLFAEQSLQGALELVCRLAHETIVGSAGAAVTLIHEGYKRSPAYSGGEFVRQADELQYEMDEGPCISAWRDKAVYRIDSMSDERRWPRWVPAAAAMGIESSLSVPMLVQNSAIGAAKVYSRRPNEYGDRDERLLMMFAEHAAIALANVSEYTSAKELTSQLKEALETRDTIGMAKGILIAQEGVDERGAFDMLRTASQTENIRLREIARRLVEEATGRSRG